MTLEEQLAAMTNSRNALMLSTDQLYKDNQKALADHAKALADQARKNQEAITKLEQDHATALATKATELATKTSQLEAVTQAKTALDLTVATLTTEKQTLTSELATANTTIAMLQAEVAKLIAIRQYNPRWTTPDYFINRFTAKEAKAFYSSSDPIIVGGRELLEEYETADPPYYVDLDDAQVQGLTGYMVQLGMMSMERRDQVLSDVTAQEAFYPA
jgi:predicted RNase H-like nuclease (RuvC/YqgF family)